MMENKNYKYTRNEIVNMILKSPQTKNGIYWNKEIGKKLRKKGKLKKINDEGYLLERSFFYEKNFYTKKDIYYLITQNSEKIFLDDWIKLNIEFNNKNKDLLNKKLNDYVEGLKVEEVIDVFLFYIEYFYNI